MKYEKKRNLAFLTLFCTIASLLPIMPVSEKSLPVYAATSPPTPVSTPSPGSSENIGTLYIEGVGDVTLFHQSDDGYSYGFDENRNLVATTVYVYNPDATFSYDTTGIIIGINDSNGNPTGLDNEARVKIDLTEENDVAQRYDHEAEGNQIRTTFTIPEAKVQEALKKIIRDGNTEGTIYFSQTFTTKEKKEDGTWEYFKEYDSLEDIRDNGVSDQYPGSSWSTETKNNFENYFDTPIDASALLKNPEPITPIPSYTVTVLTDPSDGEGGVAGGGGTYSVGDSVSLWASANTGWKFTGWSGTMSSASFTMPAYNVTMTAHFEKADAGVTPVTEKKYTVYVSASPSEGGRVSSGGTYAPGESVYKTVSVVNSGWTFVGWTGTDGLTSDRTSRGIRFTMPERDVYLTAMFQKDGTTVTLPAEATPTPIPTPTPMPTPTPIPASTYTCQENYRYYTTDKGYTIEGLFPDMVYAGTSGDSSGNKSTLWGQSLSLNGQYLVGTDSEGNEWYFREESGEALYVHPKIYNGYNVSTQAAYITELTFPSGLTYNGTSYPVISIGGAMDWYVTNSHISGGMIDTTTQVVYERPSYGYTQSINGSSSVYSNDMSYQFGVLGNGVVYSEGGVKTINTESPGYSTSDISITSKRYVSSYTVYNTTLREVTIPSSVTKIEDCAFLGCNALEHIYGADKVKDIGKYAFGGGYVQARLSTTSSDGSYLYYHFNESFKTALPLTRTMTQYNDSAALATYLPLPTFKSVRSIDDYGFIGRSNLRNVVISDRIQYVGLGAFENCELSSVTINELDVVFGDKWTTLGSKGCLFNENSRTVIITTPNASAVEYGLEYREFYSLRCGYDVIYVNNFSPEETFTTKAELVTELSEIVTTLDVGYVYGEILLDSKGHLWYQHPANASLQEINLGSNVTKIELVSLTTETSTYDSTNSVYVKTPGELVFAYTENGEVYKCTGRVTDASGTENQHTTTWANIGIPEGSGSFQWIESATTKYNLYDDSYGAHSDTTMITKKYLFYLSKEHRLFYKEMGGSTHQTNLIVNGTQYEDSAYPTWVAPESAEPVEIPLPEGISAQALFAPERQPGGAVTRDISNADSDSVNDTYKGTLCLPTIYVFASDGNYWVCYANETTDQRYEPSYRKGWGNYPYTTPVSEISVTNEEYVWSETDIIDAWSPSISSLLLTSSDCGYWAIDKNGDLLWISGVFPSPTKTVTEEGLGFVKKYRELHNQPENREDRFSILEDKDGYFWSFDNFSHSETLTRQDRTFPVLQLFNDATPVTSWSTISVSGSTGLATLTDSLNRTWDLYKQSLNAGGTDVVSTTYGTCLFDSEVRIRKLERHGDSVIVLLENGEIWAYGTNSVYQDGLSAYGQNMYDFTHSSFCYIGATTSSTPVKISGDYKFADMNAFVSKTIRSGRNTLYTELYTLALDEEGNVYRTGYTTGRTGNLLSEKKYAGFMPTEEEWIVETDESTLFAGYHYEDALYGCMFQRDDYVFVNWNEAKDNTGTLLYPGDALEITKDTTLYAQWEPVCNKVRYHPNGGSGSLMEDTVTTPPAGNRVTLRKNTYYLGGYTFDGWNTRMDGSGTSYADEAEFIMKEGTTTLYAQWKKMDKYTIKVAENEEDVRPVTFSATKSLEYEQNYTIPTALADRVCTVDYRINGETYQTLYGMSTTPKWTTAQPFSEDYTKAVQTFAYWMLYEEAEADVTYNYLGKYYLAGSKANRLTRDPSYASVLFPLWSGKNSEVRLPEVQCDGYRIIGWSESATDKDVAFVSAPEGSSSLYKPMKENTVLYAHYRPIEYKIELVAEVEDAEPGDIIQTQKTVWMTFDKEIPAVTPPTSSTYTFMGYYDKLDATGIPTSDATMYYDADGSPVLDTEGSPIIWRIHDKSVMRLYAYFKEAHGEEIEPEEPVVIQSAGDGAVVQIYADDKNPATGAETDELPYFVSDAPTENGDIEKGGIPSTEPVVVRAKVDAWMVSCRFVQRCGVDMVRAYVTVPYRTQYTDLRDGSVIVSERQTRVVEVTVPKAWSYWELEEGGVYFPEKVVVRNQSLAGEEVEVPVRWDTPDAVQKPEYTITVYGEKEQHISFDSYDEDGTPTLFLSLEKEQYIVSDVPGQLPDVDRYLLAAAKNVARKDQTQFTVKNDGIEVAGVILLSDKMSGEGHGEAPRQEATESLKARMEETAYSQTYCPGIVLMSTIPNGTYDTEAYAVYRLAVVEDGESTVDGASVTGSETGNNATEGWNTIEVPIEKTNGINIHTPVICIPEVSGNHEELYQGKTIPDNHRVLILDEEGQYSEFLVFVNNTGYHSGKRGYKERDYVEYLAETDGKVRNEVCFPFAVWLDAENDDNKENDRLLPAGEWYVLGTEKQRFYLPIETEEGSYEVVFRSVAVNGIGKETASEWVHNTMEENYVAENRIKVYVAGRLCEFSVTDVSGMKVWDEMPEEETYYTVGTRPPEHCLWDTLPLRKGVHPLYRNLGGLPQGGTISFSVKTMGLLWGEDATVQAEPHLFVVENGTCREVDVYYEEETESGPVLKSWNPEEQRMYLEKEDTGTAIGIWTGTFTLPKKIYVTERGTDVWSYRELYGLSFTESFWITDTPLLLRFALWGENEAGELLYYGMIPEEIVNNIWQTEAKVLSREDYDKRNFQIFGGEIAVIYPGENTSVGQTSQGIY